MKNLSCPTEKTEGDCGKIRVNFEHLRWMRSVDEGAGAYQVNRG